MIQGTADECGVKMRRAILRGGGCDGADPQGHAAPQIGAGLQLQEVVHELVARPMWVHYRTGVIGVEANHFPQHQNRSHRKRKLGDAASKVRMLLTRPWLRVGGAGKDWG